MAMAEIENTIGDAVRLHVLHGTVELETIKARISAQNLAGRINSFLQVVAASSGIVRDNQAGADGEGAQLAMVFAVSMIGQPIAPLVEDLNQVGLGLGALLTNAQAKKVTVQQKRLKYHFGFFAVLAFIASMMVAFSKGM